MSDILIARQPIFDRRNQLAGYEMLYRPAGALSGARETIGGHTLIAGLLTVGLEQLVGDARAFVRLSHLLLLERAFDLLDPTRVTIEVADSVPPDADTLEAIRAARTAGFTIAAAECVAAPEARGLLELAHIVRVDVSRHTPEALAALVPQLDPHRTMLLADQVNDNETAERCRALGFSLFQGQRYSRPQIVKRRDLPAGMTGIARIMNAVLDPRTSDRDLENAFRADPGLSLKLLRVVNSAAIGGRGIESIQHAARLIGRTPLHRWLSLLFADAMPRGTGVERELVIAALARGRLCELVAINSGHATAAPSAFLTGLLSSFDAILGMSIRELLAQVRVSQEVEAALLHRDGPYTPFLELATLYGEGRWDEALVVAQQLGVDEHVPVWYTQSAAWARNILVQ